MIDHNGEFSNKITLQVIVIFKCSIFVEKGGKILQFLYYPSFHDESRDAIPKWCVSTSHIIAQPNCSYRCADVHSFSQKTMFNALNAMEKTIRHYRLALQLFSGRWPYCTWYKGSPLAIEICASTAQTSNSAPCFDNSCRKTWFKILNCFRRLLTVSCRARTSSLSFAIASLSNSFGRMIVLGSPR